MQTDSSIISSSISEEDKVRAIIDSISKILSSNFGDSSQKSTIKTGGQRINFACPYCGDSTRDPRKKRGNIFLNTLSFHCYNCGEHRTLSGFLTDYGVRIDQWDTIGKLALDSLALRNTTFKFVNSERILDAVFNDDVSSLMFEREFVKRKLGLVEIEYSRIYTYLEKRMQTDFRRFLWNPKSLKLYILNSNLKNDKIIGWQVRNFDKGHSGAKYLTYKWSKICEILDFPYNPDEVDVDAIDKLSYTFNLFNIDFSKIMTVFEGPLDSLLFPNSIGLSSLHNSLPFEYENLRYLLDYDDAGQKKSMELLSNGKSVFLWKKFLKEHDINIRSKKLDWSDIMVHCRIEQKRIGSISSYFSNDKYDIIHI